MSDGSKSGKRAPRAEKPGEGSRGEGSRTAAPGRARDAGSLDDPIQRAIGEKLRAVFEEVVQQPVPERFSELLRKLAEQEQQKK